MIDMNPTEAPGRWGKIPGFRGKIALAALALVTLTGAVAYQRVPQRTIVAFGDSYFSGYGLDPTHSFPVQFEKALRKRVRCLREALEGARARPNAVLRGFSACSAGAAAGRHSTRTTTNTFSPKFPRPITTP